MLSDAITLPNTQRRTPCDPALSVYEGLRVVFLDATPVSGLFESPDGVGASLSLRERSSWSPPWRPPRRYG